jgi:hypothetical protein
MDLIRNGMRAFFAGARRGNAPLTGIGTLLMAAGVLRRTARPKRELVYSRKLRRGDVLRIRLLQPEDPMEGEAPPADPAV